MVTGVLKHSLNENVHGVSIAGGKGKKSRETKNEIPKLAEKHYNLSSAKMENLSYSRRMADESGQFCGTGWFFVISPCNHLTMKETGQ